MHSGAGILALMAIYAAKEGKFWQMHDLLYTLRDSHEIGTRSLAEAVGLDPLGLNLALRDPEIIGKLRDDLREGLRLGITGTPTFVIDGKVYQGQLPPDIQDRLLQ
jgi:protein-disulfide isomerase